MERMIETSRTGALCPHLLAACIFATPSRRRPAPVNQLKGVLAQLAAEGRLQ